MRLIVRTFFRLFRVCIIAASLTLSGWTALAAPEPWERRALDLPPGPLDWDERQGLREMRLLRVVMHVAPGLMVDLLARSAPHLSRNHIARVLHDTANGVPARTAAPEPQTHIAQELLPGRRHRSGAKFVRVE